MPCKSNRCDESRGELTVTRAAHDLFDLLTCSTVNSGRPSIAPTAFILVEENDDQSERLAWAPRAESRRDGFTQH